MIDKYLEFRSKFQINENLSGAKKLVKDTFILNRALGEVSGLRTDSSGLILKNKEGDPVKIFDVPQEAKDSAKQKIRDKSIKLSEDDNRKIERNEKITEIRTLLGDKLGYASLFMYLYIVELVPMEELKSILDGLTEYSDLLGKMRRPISNYIDPNIPNNAEQLADDIEELKRYRKLKKFYEEFTSDLKKDYQTCPPVFKNKLIDIAAAFDEIGKKEDGTIDVDKQRSTQKRFFDKIRRYKTIRELLSAAELFLKSESNAGISNFYNSIEECNKKYGNYGVNLLYDEGGLLIMEVRSFSACKHLFSNTSWCIASSKYHWDSYVGGDEKFSKQYSIVNFNLPPSNNNSIIGITIDPGQKIRACHSKNDSNLNPGVLKVFNEFEKELGLSKDFIWSGLKPMSEKEIEGKKKRIKANKDLIKPGIKLEDLRRLIVDDGGDVNYNNGQALENAVMENDLKKAEFLLDDHNASPNLKTKQDAIINKVKSFDMLKLLIRHHADLTQQVFKPLINDYEAVKFLLDEGMDPNFEDHMPLRLAVKAGNLEVVKLLKERGAKFDTTRVMQLKHAAEYQRWDILDYIVKEIPGMNVKFDKVLDWVGHTMKLSDEEKVSALTRLQKMIDDGIVTCSEGNDYVVGTGSNRQNFTLAEIIKKYGSVKNWILSRHDKLQKFIKK